jgi:hypothetical protein
MPVPAVKKAAARKPAKKPGVTRLETEFDFARETPGTFKFDELGDREAHVSGSIYIKKGPLDGTKPSRIKVTIEILGVQQEQ